MTQSDPPTYDHFRDLIRSALGRALEDAGDLDLDGAVASVVQALNGLRIFEPRAIEEHVRSIASAFTQHAIVNPAWLKHRGIKKHMFLINGRHDTLERLLRSEEATDLALSHYVVYGEWDSVVILNAPDDRARAIADVIGSLAYQSPIHMVLDRAGLFYGQPVGRFSDPSDEAMQVLEELVKNYSSPVEPDLRRDLTDSGVLLGRTWRASGHPPHPIRAFAGVMQRGRYAPDVHEILRAMMEHRALKDCLVHLFSTRSGRPYDLVAKLACATTKELDLATEAFGALRLGSLRFESETMIVATGTDLLPSVTSKSNSQLNGSAAILERASRLLGAEFVSTADQNLVLQVYASVVALRSSLNRALLTADLNSVISSAIHAFTQEAQQLEHSRWLNGPVSTATGSVENTSLSLVYSLVTDEYGRDATALERALGQKLPRRRRAAFRDAYSLLRAMSGSTRFEAVHDLLDDEHLDRLDELIKVRNRWTHVGIGSSGPDRVLDARAAITESIHILEWLDAVQQTWTRSAPE